MLAAATQRPVRYNHSMADFVGFAICPTPHIPLEDNARADPRTYDSECKTVVSACLPHPEFAQRSGVRVHFQYDGDAKPFRDHLTEWHIKPAHIVIHVDPTALDV